MPGRADCPHCPYRDRADTPCAVLATGHRRFCEVVEAGSAGHRPDLVAALDRLTLEALGRPVAPRPAAAPGPPPPPRVPVSVQAARLKAVRACPHWEKSSSCGCGVNRCALGKGRGGLVTLADCLACLAAGAPPGP